ncbi:hypothetical protein HK097_007408 [Rhizophlyctis rosea]|uniref:BRCT domain-containing protein n=1 Tax=Rhizophlyctis rosea TaxID=64517 RepID=A0AAD5SKF1_9FUNG|nr:hypothetical protein HK097_007408 [Rhizophlyctis rosea]
MGGREDGLAITASPVGGLDGNGLDEISTPIFCSWTQQGKPSEPVAGGLVGVEEDLDWEINGFDDSQCTENENTADGGNLSKTPPLKESQLPPTSSREVKRAGSRRERLSLTPTLNTQQSSVSRKPFFAIQDGTDVDVIEQEKFTPHAISLRYSQSQDEDDMDEEVDNEQLATTVGPESLADASKFTAKVDTAPPTVPTPEKAVIPQLRRALRKPMAETQIDLAQPPAASVPPPVKIPLLVPSQLKRVDATKPIDIVSFTSRSAVVSSSSVKQSTSKLPGSSSSTGSARSMVGTAEERYAELRRSKGLGPLHLVTVGQRAAVPPKVDLPATQPACDHVDTGLDDDDEDVRQLLHGVRSSSWEVEREETVLTVAVLSPSREVSNSSVVTEDGEGSQSKHESPQGIQVEIREERVTSVDQRLVEVPAERVVPDGRANSVVDLTNDTQSQPFRANEEVILTNNPAAASPPEKSNSNDTVIVPPGSIASTISPPVPHPTIAKSHERLTTSPVKSPQQEQREPTADIVEDSVDEDAHQSPLKRKRPLADERSRSLICESDTVGNVSSPKKRRTKKGGEVKAGAAAPSPKRTFPKPGRTFRGGQNTYGALEPSSEISPVRVSAVPPSSPLRISAPSSPATRPVGPTAVPQPSPSVAGTKRKRKNAVEKEGGTSKKRGAAPVVIQDANSSPSFTQMRAPISMKACAHCGTRVTTAWRTGPDRTKSLCNGCGRQYKQRGSLPGGSNVATEEEMVEQEVRDGTGGSEGQGPSRPEVAPPVLQNRTVSAPSSPAANRFEFDDDHLDAVITRRSVRKARSKASPKYKNDSSSSEEDDVEKDGDYMEGRRKRVVDTRSLTPSGRRTEAVGSLMDRKVVLTENGHAKASEAAAGSMLEVGDQVWARWETDGLFYAATVNARFGNGDKYSVEYEYDGKSAIMNTSKIRPFNIKVGHKCMIANGGSRSLFPATVVEIIDTGQSYNVQMDSGKEDKAGKGKKVVGKATSCRTVASNKLVISEQMLVLNAEAERAKKGKVVSGKKGRFVEGEESPDELQGAAVDPVELMGPMPVNKRLFRGFGIVLTVGSRGEPGSDDEDDGPSQGYHSHVDKSYVSRQIVEGGGTIIRDWAEVLDFKERATKPHCPATVLLVSSRPARTKKYLIAVGMGFPVISSTWVKDCCTNNVLEEFDGYPLSNGWLVADRVAFVENVFYSVNAIELMEVSCQWIGAVKSKLKGVFADTGFYVFSRTSAFKRDWEEIILAAGGKVVSKKALGTKIGGQCQFVLCERSPNAEEKRFFQQRTNAVFVSTEVRVPAQQPSKS